MDIKDIKREDYLLLFNKIDELLKRKQVHVDASVQMHEEGSNGEINSPVIIAIDGPCGAGKSTLGELLKSEYDCNLFHMDDFFLQPHQRTPERFASPGGNVDYERFLEEVLKPTWDGRTVAYRRFNCSTMTIGEPEYFEPKQLTVIEGSYSLRPELRDYYDLSVFLDISPEIQKERIINRNSMEKAQMFITKWIPMENRYFNYYDIKNAADLVITQMVNSL